MPVNCTPPSFVEKRSPTTCALAAFDAASPSAASAASVTPVSYTHLYVYAPNMRGSIENRFIQSPLDLERTLGLRRGNVMHLEMSLDQMFSFRPLPELSEYQTPIPGLFLSGASTHPGGGVFGASGVSAARVVGHALRKST